MENYNINIEKEFKENFKNVITIALTNIVYNIIFNTTAASSGIRYMGIGIKVFLIMSIIVYLHCYSDYIYIMEEKNYFIEIATIIIFSITAIGGIIIERDNVLIIGAVQLIMLFYNGCSIMKKIKLNIEGIK